MKNVVKVTALSLGLALASGFAAADENIAFINAGYLFQNHPDRQAVADKLDAEFKPMADKLAASKKEIDDKIVASRKKVEAKVSQKPNVSSIIKDQYTIRYLFPANLSV